MSLVTNLLAPIRSELDRLDRSALQGTPLGDAVEKLRRAAATEQGVFASMDEFAEVVALMVATIKSFPQNAALLSQTRGLIEAVSRDEGPDGSLARSLRAFDAERAQYDLSRTSPSRSTGVSVAQAAADRARSASQGMSLAAAFAMP